MQMPILIGLTGKKSAGKSTVGGYIKDWAQENGQQAQLQGFADSLKLSFARIFVPDCTLEEALLFCDTIKNQGSIKHDTIFKDTHLFDRFGRRNVISGREALQHYGTEAHRDVFGTDFWVDQLLPTGLADNGESISDMDYPAWWDKWDDEAFAIITDLRFPNEAQRVKQLGGEIWEITRPELEAQADSHASEQALPRELVDEGIVNSSTLEDLKSLVYKLCDYTYSDEEYNEHVKSQLGERVYHGL